MRPNIDITWELHGRIRDFAEAHGMTLTRAYYVLLNKGLEAEEVEE